MHIKYVTKQNGKHHSVDLDVDEKMTLNKEEKGCDPKSRNGFFFKVLNITYMQGDYMFNNPR
jgi:hypothetical protein